VSVQEITLPPFSGSYTFYRDTILKIATLGLGLGVGLSFLAAFGWPFEILSHFRVQFFYASLAAIISHSLLTKDWIFVVVSIFLAAVNLLPIGSHFVFVQSAPAAKPTDMPVRVVFSNLLHHPRHLRAAAAYAETQGADILVITEIPLTVIPRLDTFVPEYPHQVVSGNRNTLDVAILSKHPIVSHGMRRINPGENPVLDADISVGGETIRVVALHPKKPLRRWTKRGRDRSIESAFNIAGSADHAVVVGDFNTTLWSPVLWRQRDGFHTTFNVRPTWLTSIPLFGLTIDHLFASHAVAIEKRKVGPFIGSDHYPVLFDLRLRQQDPARGPRPFP